MADRKTLIDQFTKAIKDDDKDKGLAAAATLVALTLQDIKRIADALETIARESVARNTRP